MDASDSHENKFNVSFTRAEKLRSEGKYVKAIKNFSTAIKLGNKLTKQKNKRLCDSLLGLARCQYRLGNSREAEQNFKLALSFLNRNSKKNKSSQIATILWEIAVLYTEEKRYAEGAIAFKNAIVLTDKNEKFIADCLWGLSKCFCAMGRLNAAEESIKNALEIYQKYGNDCINAVIINRKNLASILIEKNCLDEALKEIDKALKLLVNPLSHDLDEFSKMYFRIAWQGQKVREYERAEKALRKALELTRKSHGARSPMCSLVKIAIAHNKVCLKNYSAAEKLLVQSINHLRKVDSETFKHDICGSLYELGLCYLRQKQIKKAIRILEELLIYHEEDPLFMPELFADTLHSLAQCHELDCNLAKAKELNQRSIFIKEQIYGVMHEEVAQTLFQLSSCLIKLDDRHEADFAKSRASEITEALYSAS